MILPAITLAFAMAAKYTRQVRTAVLEELNKDYVIGAKARGLSYGKILLRHVFPNSLLPLITLLGLSLGSLLGGTAVVEVIFSYPGLGNLAVTSITAYDYPVIQAYVLWIALIYMIINLIVDLSYTLVDPKVKRERLVMKNIKTFIKKNKLFSALIVMAIIIALVAIFAPVLAPYSPYDAELSNAFPSSKFRTFIWNR